MHENETVSRHNCYRKDGCQDDEGVTACFTSADANAMSSGSEIHRRCLSQPASGRSGARTAEQTIVAVVNAYDGTYAAATCEPDAHLSSIVRGLQVRLYSGQCVESSGTFLPASTVLSALGRWERQIALVFGRQYAAMLVAGAVGTRSPGEMTRDDLESIRLLLSSAIGGCMFLEKVDK